MDGKASGKQVGAGKGEDGSHRGRGRAKPNYGSSARVKDSHAKSFQNKSSKT